MSKNNNKLFNEFSPTDKKAWSDAAEATLRDGDNLAKFKIEVDDHVILEPYYDKSDLENREYLIDYQNRLYFNENWPRYWENLQQIRINDISIANLQARDILLQTDGIVFDTCHLKNVPFTDLLDQIIIDQYNITFKSGSIDLLDQYKKYLHGSKVEKKNIQAAFTIKSSDNLSTALEAFKLTPDLPKLRVIELKSNAEHPSEQIADILLKSVQVMDQLFADYTITDITDKMMLTVDISPDYFLEISKIRALRMLFFQLCRSYGGKLFLPEHIHIHANSTTWTDERYQPHANMLKSTTAAMSAILGGCNSLLIEPEDYDNPLMNRMARNISTILCEESYLDKNCDPVAGAYYIEALTDQLTQHAWSRFQNLISKN